ncbi:hypothetical protein J6590_081716 [Homalodisca vitripennis]|nr:hypothetical protein J6590_081716 [Homalodisca vitripennis]
MYQLFLPLRGFFTQLCRRTGLRSLLQEPGATYQRLKQHNSETGDNNWNVQTTVFLLRGGHV